MTKRKARHAGLVMVREPSGRLSRATMVEIDGVSPGQAKRLRDAALRGMAAPEYGTELGYMFLSGKLPSELFEAGRRWARLVISYYEAIGATPPYPKGQHFERFEPTHPSELDERQEKIETWRARAIISDMREAHGVLLAAGALAERAVRELCEEDRVPVGHIAVLAVDRGLMWLASHWGLTDQRLPR